MICVYDPLASVFDGNGKAALVPTGGSIKMVAGGDYSFSMEHPLDPWDKWKELKREAIVRLPVPEEVIPNSYTGIEADIYKTTAEADLYESPEKPESISYTAWSIYNNYQVGDKVTFSGQNYQCIFWNDDDYLHKHLAPSGCTWWKKIPNKTAGAPVLMTAKSGTELYFVEDVDTTWIKLSTSYGLVGYMLKSKVTYDHHASASENQPRTITEQLFRIKDVQVDRDNGKVNVSGVHVSYDLKGNLVSSLEIGQASPAMAIGRIAENLMMDYQGMIATDMTDTSDGTFTGSFTRKNGMFCLTDPDTGVVAAFNAKFTRDNWDLFVMRNTDTDRGYRIRYAKNVNGIQWREKTDGLVTRVVPVAKDANGNDLLLPEVYVDSDHISDYPVIYMETLKVSGQVGKDDGSGTNTVWTESALLDEMRAKAEERFTIDNADVPLKEVTVQLKQLEKTAEYAWMQDLLKVLMYDIVTVSDPEIGKSEQLKVTEIEWDYIQKKITGLKLSNVENSVTRTVTGYSVANASIGSEKLKDEVVDEIVGLASDTAVEESSQRIISQQLNTKDYDGSVAKGDGNANKVWKTDANGNPAWRDDSPGSQSDGDPTLAWGQRSTVGTVNGTDLHVTMPANPDTWRPVQDNLDSTSATDALSANQGKVLDEKKANITKSSVSGGSTKTINFTRGMIVVGRASAGIAGLYYIDGIGGVTTIVSANNITVTYSSGQVSIANSSGSIAYIDCIN